MKNKVLENLEQAAFLISEASQLLDLEIVVEEVESGELELTQEFEECVHGITQVQAALEKITTTKKEKGVLDVMMEQVKDLVTEKYFEKRAKLRKYEGELVTIGYREVERKEIGTDPDPRFVEVAYKPKTKAIDEFRKSTVSDEHPQGKLPQGITLKKYQYVTFKQN